MHILKRHLRQSARLSPAIIVIMSVGCVSPDIHPVRVIAHEHEQHTYNNTFTNNHEGPDNNNETAPTLRLGAGDRLGHALAERYRESQYADQ